MGWAARYIENLNNGKNVTFRPRGNSMQGKIESGQLCTVTPITEHNILSVGDIVLCKVKGNEFLHIIKAIRSTSQYLIGNNKGGTNGWISKTAIYGKLISVEN